MQLRELNFLSDVMRWMRWKTICEFLGRKYRYFSFSYEDLSFTWVLRKMISSWNAKELAAAANWSVNCGKFLGNRNALGLGILPNMVVFIPETLPTVFLCGVGFLTSIDFSAFIKADGFRHAVKCRLSWVSEWFFVCLFCRTVHRQYLLRRKLDCWRFLVMEIVHIFAQIVNDEFPSIF